jgi:hypothetical protein
MALLAGGVVLPVFAPRTPFHAAAWVSVLSVLMAGMLCVFPEFRHKVVQPVLSKLTQTMGRSA